MASEINVGTTPLLKSRVALPALLCALLAIGVGAAGCGDDVIANGGVDAGIEEDVDAGTTGDTDAGTGEDDAGNGSDDAGETDAGIEPDAGLEPDAGIVPDAGLPPEPETIATGWSQLFGIAVDDTHVYFSEYNAPNGTVLKVSKNGGAVDELAGQQSDPKYVTARGGFVFYNSNTGVMSVPSSGGTSPTALVTETGVTTVAANDTHVFWLNRDKGTLGRMTLAGTDLTTLVTLVPGAGNEKMAESIALNDTHVFFATIDDSVKARVLTVAQDAAADTTPDELVKDQQGGVGSLAADADNVYWSVKGDVSCSNAQSVWWQPLSGGTPDRLGGNQHCALGMALGDTHLYTTNFVSGLVWKIPLPGQPGDPVAWYDSVSDSLPNQIALDEDELFFTLQSRGQVWKMKR